METSDQEQALRNAVIEWAPTAAALHRFAAWLEQQAVLMDRLNTERPQRRHYTYQPEYRRCGKPTCHCASGEGHGPYWYAYWTEGGKTKRQYIGRQRVDLDDDTKPQPAPRQG